MKRIYRVSFFKRLTDSTGHPSDVCQGTVEVDGDRKARALDAARRRFAELKDVVAWTLRADYAKVEVVGNCHPASNDHRLKAGTPMANDPFALG